MFMSSMQTAKQIVEVQKLIEEHVNEIRSAWTKHFPSGSH